MFNRNCQKFHKNANRLWSTKDLKICIGNLKKIWKTKQIMAAKISGQMYINVGEEGEEKIVNMTKELFWI